MTPISKIELISMNKRANLLILGACLVLGSYLFFLILSNFQAQSSLLEVSLKRICLDLDKRSTSLEYYFSERKHDLSFIAGSREVSAYFVNKSLGMSEAYGLKVNLFVINQLLSKTIENKTVQGDSIYERLFLIDLDEQVLVDTNLKIDDELIPTGLFDQFNRSADEAQLVIYEADNRLRMVLSAPCVVKGEKVGEVVAVLQLDSLMNNFVDIGGINDFNRFDLVYNNRWLIRSEQMDANPDLLKMIGKLASDLPLDRFEKVDFIRDQAISNSFVVVRKPISQVPLNLLAWTEEKTVSGSLTLWQHLLGPGLLIIILLTSVIKIIRFKTSNIILQTRIDEATKQQKELKSKNNQLNEEMEHRLRAEGELELQRTLSVRSDRLRSLGEMAAGIAHELSQPLTGVRGMAELIPLICSKQRAPEQQKIVDCSQVIVEQSDRMVHIIDHVRLFAREAGKVETSTADLNDVVKSATSLITAQFKSHDIELKLELTEKELSVQINPFSVEEVVLNLLTNARDALECKQSQECLNYKSIITICSAVREENNQLLGCLHVSDNGNGIPSTVADKMFDPFFTTKDPDKGTGLGLSISKSIVEEMGGTISFVTQGGEGSTFTICFPLVSER